MIYVIEQEGLYENKVNSSLVSTCNCQMRYWLTDTVCLHGLPNWGLFRVLL